MLFVFSMLLKRAVLESMGKVGKGRFSVQNKEELQIKWSCLKLDWATLHFPITENVAVGAEWPECSVSH